MHALNIFVDIEFARPNVVFTIIVFSSFARTCIKNAHQWDTTIYRILAEVHTAFNRLLDGFNHKEIVFGQSHIAVFIFAAGDVLTVISISLVERHSAHDVERRDKHSTTLALEIIAHRTHTQVFLCIALLVVIAVHFVFCGSRLEFQILELHHNHGNGVFSDAVHSPHSTLAVFAQSVFGRCIAGRPLRRTAALGLLLHGSIFRLQSMRFHISDLCNRAVGHVVSHHVACHKVTCPIENSIAQVALAVLHHHTVVERGIESQVAVAILINHHLSTVALCNGKRNMTRPDGFNLQSQRQQQQRKNE